MYIDESQIQIKNEPYVELIIEGDCDNPWEGGINGVFYRMSRGIPIKVPMSLAKLIYLNSRVRVISETVVSDYKSGSGKCLNAPKKVKAV